MTFSKRHDPYPVNDPYHGIYAHGVEVPANARTLYVSGQVGEATNGELSTNFREQCRQALTNLHSVLNAADMDYKDIVKLSFYLVRRRDMDDLVDVRKEILDGVRPAITTVFVNSLVSEEWLIEVEAIACA